MRELLDSRCFAAQLLPGRDVHPSSDGVKRLRNLRQHSGTNTVLEKRGKSFSNYLVYRASVSAMRTTFSVPSSLEAHRQLRASRPCCVILETMLLLAHRVFAKYQLALTTPIFSPVSCSCRTTTAAWMTTSLPEPSGSDTTSTSSAIPPRTSNTRSPRVSRCS
jgi:hypothetical protein